MLRQLLSAAKDRIGEGSFATWRERLRGRNSGKQEEQEALLGSSEVPIHPLRLCKEVRDFIDRDAILVVDGQEILNFGRQTIPSFVPNHRMNSGVFGTMGVGLPLGVGAKLAAPDKQVVVLHGDGSFGMNAMEFDTAVRHGAPVLVVISQNGGWTADPDRAKPGRDLGYPRYDRLAEVLGGHGEHVEDPTTSGRPWSAPPPPSPRASRRWSTWSPTGAPARPPRRSPSTRRDRSASATPGRPGSRGQQRREVPEDGSRRMQLLAVRNPSWLSTTVRFELAPTGCAVYSPPPRPGVACWPTACPRTR